MLKIHQDALYDCSRCTILFALLNAPSTSLPWQSQWNTAGFPKCLWDTILLGCQKAGISGYKTNHSLRATTATRLYLNGVDEQLVMERTGHRSIEGIRSYKRTSSDQQENISDLLHGKKPCMDLVPAANKQPLVPALPLVTPPTLPSSCSQVVTSNISAPQTSSSKNDHAGAFYLTSCSNVSINFHYTPTHSLKTDLKL